MVDIDHLNKIKRRYQQLRGKQEVLQEQLDTGWTEEKRLQMRLADAVKARYIIQLVSNQTQKNLEFHISNLTTMALAAVFPDPYEFVTRFVIRSNRTECDMFFVQYGQEMDPMSSVGGGVKDVTSFSLRVAYWSLSNLRNVLIVDEPFKYVSVDLQNKCSEMIRLVANTLKVQILMVSHLPEINVAANNIINIKKVGKVSRCD